MRRHLPVLVAVLVAASQLDAQTDSVPMWPIGSKVRVWTSARENVVGHLTEVRADTLVIDPPGMFLHSRKKVLTRLATRLEVSDGKGVSPERIAGGALGGAALGVAVLAVLDIALGDLCPLGECEETRPPYVRAGIIGAVAGAVAGAVTLDDKWRELRMPGRVTFAPSGRRTAVGLSFAFR